MVEYHKLPSEEVMKLLDSSTNGLTAAEASRRLEKYGPNQLEREKKVSPVWLFINQFKNGLVILLLVASSASFFIGEALDSLLILAIVVLNGVFGFVQEYRAEKSLEKLRQLSSLTAHAIRGGAEQKIDASGLVPGDLLVLREGDKISADARIIESKSLHTLEGTLTGESMPVSKQSGVQGPESRVQSPGSRVSRPKTEDSGPETSIPLGDRVNMAYAGTLVASGYAKCIVIATGASSELGKIATLLKDVKHEKTAFQTELNSFSESMGKMVIAICVLVIILVYLLSKDIGMSLLVGISLAVAAVPEGLPAVLTLSLALAVQRMVSRNVLVRNLPAVETLGSINVICTDKTGTLTKNEMTVKKAYVPASGASGKYYEFGGVGYSVEGKILPNPDDALKFLLEIGATCNNATLPGKLGDPTELALLVSAKKADINPIPGTNKLREFAFTSERKMMSVVVNKNGKYFLYSKGAPETILAKCSFARSPGSECAALENVNKSLASQAYRVLAFAFCELHEDEVNFSESELEKGLTFAGFQAMYDPPKDEVQHAVSLCHRAGVDVKMITGDHRETAVAIAKSLGIPGSVITGAELEQLGEKGLTCSIAGIGVFARTAPEQKLMIVNVLKSLGYRVALTGDGVNDAPALKRADIGVAMGIAGTDVAKEASAIIILDDNFATIVNGIEEGRRIFSNIRKFVAYLLAFNIAEVLALLISTLAFQFVPLLPVQLLWLNLVTDGLPAVALALDSSERGVMERKPHSVKLLDNALLRQMGFIGALVTLISVYLIWSMKAAAAPESLILTMVFTFFVFAELIGVHIIRSYYSHPIFTNKWLWLSIIATLLVHLMLLYTPLNAMFKIVPLALSDWLVLGEAIAIMVAVSVAAKKIRLI
ncbi:ATPase [Candidatus Micrarchaeota archaeon CG08_land_8_20_14_0_20_49_17]|nr:MAG: ATPase [Candidatus Micrarchaeota archaeon CG08_land_8_20_14_0_20_49_17]